MKISATCVSVVSLILATACGAAEQGSLHDLEGAEGEWAANEAAANALEQVAGGGSPEGLHRFEVQGTQYSYLRDGDGVLLHVQTSRTAPRLQVQTETSEAPTLLEIFNALQPGVEPHPALLAAHLESAPLLGRADDRVLASFVQEVSAELVEKTAADLTDCRNTLLPIWGGGFGGGVPVVVSLEGTAAGTTLQASTASVANKFMAAGACNFAATQARRVAFDKRIGAGGFVAQLTANIAVDDLNFIVHNPTAQAVNLRSRMVDAANLGMQLVAARRQ